MIKYKTTEESGLTLVEILASLVILGIVFVAFMTIFPQMTLFNNRTEMKLETMNEARIILEEYRETKWKKESLSPPRFEKRGDWWIDTSTSKSTIQVSIKVDPAVGPPLATSLKPGVVRLHELQIKVFNGERLISESLGYIQVK